MSFLKCQVVHKEIEEMKQAGVIRPSSSPYAGPITLVPKKDSSMHFCIDYCKLNSTLGKDAYPHPNIQEIFELLGVATVFPP